MNDLWVGQHFGVLPSKQLSLNFVRGPTLLSSKSHFSVHNRFSKTSCTSVAVRTCTQLKRLPVRGPVYSIGRVLALKTRDPGFRPRLHVLLSDVQHGFHTRSSCDSKLLVTRLEIDIILLDNSKPFKKVSTGVWL